MSIKITDQTLNEPDTVLVKPKKPGGWLCWVLYTHGWNLIYPQAMKTNFACYPGPLFENREQALKQVAETCPEVVEVKLFELKF